MRETTDSIRGEVVTVRWYDREDLRGRVARIGPEVIPIPDDEIVCDLCCSHITTFPVPVLADFAFCAACWAEAMRPATTHDGQHRHSG